jgi:hypothetical protein
MSSTFLGDLLRGHLRDGAIRAALGDIEAAKISELP